MSRHTRRSLSLPARMAAAGVDRVFVAEATTLALGYGSQRLTNSQLWSDNMALHTRADLSDALLREAMEALDDARQSLVDSSEEIAELRLTLSKTDLELPWLSDAIDNQTLALAKLRAHFDGEKE